MGCDIHLFLERHHPRMPHDRWQFVREIENGLGDPGGRNYARFARLAGVRGDGPAAKGLPGDVSREVSYNYDEWGSDGHGHSWYLLEDALPIFVETTYIRPYGQFDHEAREVIPHDPNVQYWQVFGVVPEYPGQYRIVFWFDN